jgi:hypothetical protein
MHVARLNARDYRSWLSVRFVLRICGCYLQLVGSYSRPNAPTI